MKEEIERIAVYMPKKKADSLRKQAASENRSLSNLIVNLLDQKKEVPHVKKIGS